MEKTMALKEVVELAEVPFEYEGRMWVVPFSYTVTAEQSKLLEEYESKFDEHHYLCWGTGGDVKCIHEDAMVIVDTDVIEKCEKAHEMFMNDNIVVPIEERPHVPNLRILGLSGDPSPSDIVDEFLGELK